MSWKDIIGKTIKGVDEKAANVVVLKFTDGTSVTVDTEAIMHLGAGSIYRPVLY